MTDLSRIAALFDGWEETMIWSCLQGVMGRAEGSGDYASAMIENRDFCFLAGRPNEDLLRRSTVRLLVPRTEDWHPLIETVFQGKAVLETRYAIRKEPGVFDRKKLSIYASALPPGYELRMMDEAMVPLLLAQHWSRDLCTAFDSPADCCRRGIGVVALRDGVPVAGAGTYCLYQEGIEIEIDTHPDHRRRGLAAACGARLILACLDRGLYPSWDAYDLRSVALAEKLGYHLSHPYSVYWLDRSQRPPPSTLYDDGGARRATF